MRIKGLKILRVYGNAIEQEEFPIPNQVKPTRPIASQKELKVTENLRSIALHHVIRDEETSPYARQLRDYEELFASKKKKKKKVEETTVEEYLKLIKTAEKWAIRSSYKGEYVQIVLCTCSTAGSKRMKDACNNVIQCIVDECGMCLEPETIIPIVCSKAQQVVLIGDHMQLQPIVKNRVAISLGLKTSMFERFSDHAFMLNEQYRMHPDICEFPSQHFYRGKLVTSASVIERDRSTRHSRIFLNFWPSNKETDFVPLVFCHVVGEEEELVVTTKEGNQRSKSNMKEKDKVVQVVDKLVNTCGVNMNQILVLSPYRAQCHVIREDLGTNQTLSDVPVISIVKSQGSECDFVIISLVRSLPNSLIDHEPDGGWLRENLGFVTDEHQINVALTRAKRGLCIIGNKNLLEVCEMWSYLIEHYETKSCFVDSSDWP
ncbi:helicase [Desmophyllum pertusum]|uniref:Helicase n=1 Tax=Desmophyllum pertusum TaxID=174260 RepID=A0A9W9ZBE3_9CNID|nr:helicase [Desmophyllum pertusum]